MNRFNTAPADDLRPLLTDCLAVPRWADMVLAERPYASRADLLSSAESFATELTPDELHAAMAGHPRIGERRDGDAFSRTEQSGVDASLAEQLQAANQRYEERFGHIYLVFASGRSGEELLSILAARLANDPETELRVVNAELAKITVLRLGKVVTE